MTHFVSGYLRYETDVTSDPVDVVLTQQSEGYAVLQALRMIDSGHAIPQALELLDINLTLN